MRVMRPRVALLEDVLLFAMVLSLFSLVLAPDAEQAHLCTRVTSFLVDC